jgi:CheY-like chemotaxis protein
MLDVGWFFPLVQNLPCKSGSEQRLLLVMKTLNETWSAMQTTQTLPVRPAAQLASHADIVAHMRACSPRPARVADNDQGRVFVVDAYPKLASFAALLLEQGGYRTRAFDNPMTAWHAFAFARPKPDVLIAAEIGGDLTGLELLRLCRQINPQLKTILITTRKLSDLTKSERECVTDVMPLAYCGPLLIERVGELVRRESWDWEKLWSALGLRSRTCREATA